MYTITQLARLCNVSRTTILYYERTGLLLPAQRSDNGYRLYKHEQVERLKAVLSYRSFGVPVADIEPLLRSTDNMEQQALLKNQFAALEDEIQRLKKQQHAIIALLGQKSKPAIISKQRWTELMAATGMTEEDMLQWHIQFESMEPQGHQKFLESLGIAPDEIVRLRQQFSA